MSPNPAEPDDGHVRRSFDVQCFVHTNPIPAGTRLGPLLTSSIITARDPDATTVPDELGAQLDNLFHHVGEILRAGGADWHHVVRMTFYLPDLGDRAVLNEPWVAHFPDPASRPSRVTRLASGPTAQCEFIAYVAD